MSWVGGDGDEETEPQSEVWVSRDGRVTRITDMDTSHLNNTLAYLTRRGYGSAAAVYIGVADFVETTETVMLPINKLTLMRYLKMASESQTRRDQEAERIKNAEVCADDEPECDAG